MIYETKDYEVKVTTHEMRMKAQDDLDVYCIHNKNHDVIEAAHRNLPEAIQTCEQLQNNLNTALSWRTGGKNGTITVLDRKDYPV